MILLIAMFVIQMFILVGVFILLFSRTFFKLSNQEIQMVLNKRDRVRKVAKYYEDKRKNEEQEKRNEEIRLKVEAESLKDSLKGFR